MSWDDPIIVCCLLGICCPAASEAQVYEAVKVVHERHPHLTEPQCHKRAVKWLEKYDYFRDSVSMLDEGAASA